MKKNVSRLYLLTKIKKYLLLISLQVLLLNVLQAQVVTTFAGSGTSGSVDATGTFASFNVPTGVAVDASRNVYIADAGNNKIRKITPEGIVTTFAGSGTRGSIDATGILASFNSPYGVAVDTSGNIYVADRDNNKIRKITPEGVVTTLAGSGDIGSDDANIGTLARFDNPSFVAVDVSGNVYVADTWNNKIRKITSTGVVTTLAGSGTAGSVDATGTLASFHNPYGVVVDTSGNVYVADQSNNKIRKITPTGVVTTFAGSGTYGSVNATGTLASFNQPEGLAIDASGNIYVADAVNNKIRKITPAGVVTTLAGSGAIGSVDANGTLASFEFPTDMAVDASGNVYISDEANNKIRKISATGETVETAIEDQSTTIELSVFPNPTSGDLRITAPENLQLIIYNAQGIKVMEQNLLEGSNTISLENYKPGLYIIQSTNGTSKSQQYSLVKN
jgi:serine/threonine-protein kinase